MTETEFDVAMAAAKLEKARALKVASVNRCQGRPVSEYNIKRIELAQQAIDELKRHPIAAARAQRRADEKRTIKIESNKRYRARHIDRLRESAREAGKKFRQSGKAAEYQSRPEVRERRIKLKEKYRRAAGCIPREQMTKMADRAAAAAEARRLFRENFTGPPKPSKAMTEAQLYSWRLRNDPDFYAKELDRSQRYKARTRPGYKDSIVKWSDMPATVKQVKHLQYQIARQIHRRVQDENHQRAA